MPFRVRRRNEITGRTQVAPGSFPTRTEAFDAAWDNLGTLIKNNIRQNRKGDSDHPPSSETSFKVRLNLRSSELPPPVVAVIELRYDYQPDPDQAPQDWETNSIYYEIADL